MNFRGNKLLMLLMVLLLALALTVGCGGENDEPADEPQEDNEEVVEDDDEDVDEDEEEAEEDLDPAEVVWNATKPVMEGVADGNNILPFADALEMLEENPDDYFVMDIRRLEDYEEGHLPGAVHVGYNELAGAMDSVPQDLQILIYCYTGQTSGQAVAAYKAMGFDALSLGGGMNFGWAPLELDEDTLVTEGNELPEASAEWTPEQEILQVEIHRYFTQGTNYIVRPDALMEEMDGDIMIIDIRNQEVYDEGHIEGAVFMPWAELAANFDEIPTDKPVYVVCFSGQTAGQALFNLRVNGIDAYSLYRGMAGWNADEMPVVASE